MQKNINGITVEYTQRGEGTPVFLLHGWGCSGRTLESAAKIIAGKYCAISPDFPGFGASPEPPEPWDVAAYAQLTRDFIASFGCDKVLLLGHSFGGRVILKLVNIDLPFTVEKIILTGAAGIRRQPGKKAQRRVKIYKTSKAVLSAVYPKALPALQQRFGSADYNAASPLMRQILVKTVNEDLRDCMPALTMPTLLIWGENDDATPLADGREMEKLMPGAGLAVLPNAGHYAFLDAPAHFGAVIKSFLEIA
ncbi:MAG: alpha/beta hydrolase [Oscillospiraceae bacterium]|nr:alpha/beta hydrolase [Oscillospiraceae bacterium]